MRVLLAIPSPEAIGGVNYVAENLAQYLHSRGHDIVFVFPGKSIFMRARAMKFGFPGFELRMQAPFGQRHPIISVSMFLLLLPVTLFQAMWLVRKHRIDVINIHFPREHFLYFSLCSRIFRTALVTSIHGADVFRGGKLSGKRPWALRLILRASNLIVAPSKQCRNYFVSAFPNLAPKTTFIHNGINLSRFENCPQKENGEHYRRYVLSVSSCKQQKALDVLVRAFKPVHDAFPLLNLVLVGDGPLRGQLESLAASLKLEEPIKFLGYRPPADVVKLLCGCEIFVLPSRFETFGIAILEAMACKKPVIGTTAGGIPEIVQNGKNGILVEPDNPSALTEAILAVLRNQTLQRTISENGRATVEGQFSCEDTGRAYEDAFYRLIRPTDLSYGPTL